MRERVHYGALDVEDLGRVYESLLELEPGISTEAMCRLRRAKLEVVVPVAQGSPYRCNPTHSGDPEETEEVEEETDEDESAPNRGRAASGSKTKVEFIEEIAADRFFLRVGLGRKASGSYYTPHPFVRFLVQETLGVLLAECSPRDNPQPALILKLKVLDSAMGSGHFLVEACRFLGEGLYEACRLCDELAVQAEEQAEKAEGPERELHLSRAVELRRRVEDLPDPNNELLAYLPSRAAEGEESGLSQKKAEAMCRRLVAVHCLYGVDKNPLAVELAKLSLWLESYAEGLPLTFLDHRLICGDSLTGPFFEHLLTYPKSGGRLDDLFAQGLTQRLQDTLAAALVHVRDLEASVGKDLADLHLKESAKAKLDAALEPLKTLAAAWSGGVMLGNNCDDAGYQILAKAVASGEELIPVFQSRPGLGPMLKLGASAVAYLLAFPEVFYQEDADSNGFDVVVGNPPWDAIQFKSKEFLAGFDLGILEAPTARERSAVESRLLADEAISSSFLSQQEGFEQIKRANDRLYKYQKVIIDGDLAGRQLDAFRVFMERNAQLLRKYGYTGAVVPSAFHANAGATGVRQLYLEQMALQCCFSFENRKRLFDIHRSFKFAAVVSRNIPAGTDEFECGFYWQDPELLFTKKGRLSYTGQLVASMGGDYLLFFELRDLASVMLARVFSNASEPAASFFRRAGLRLQKQPLAFDMSKDSSKFIRSSDIGANVDPRFGEKRLSLLSSHKVLYLTEGKTFWQYSDCWEEPPRFCVSLDNLSSLQVANAAFFRVGMRAVASSTNERTAVFTLLGPATVVGHSVALERAPEATTNHSKLLMVAIGNTFCFDWLCRQMMGANVTLFVLGLIPFPRIFKEKAFLSHACLRLLANHDAFASLWTDQLGDTWRESSPSMFFPVVKDEISHWTLRAAIDAVVAKAYCLARSDYEHILASFNHRNFPKSPSLCLEAFDELQEIGIEAFVKKYDPYWDIPLNENLPQPVLDLKIPGQTGIVQASLGPLFDSTAAAVAQAEIGVSTAPTVTAKPAPAPAPSVRPSGNGAFATITELLCSRGVITSSDAQQATGLDAAGVRPHLQRLVNDGLAAIEGQRRGMRYRRVDD